LANKKIPVSDTLLQRARRLRQDASNAEQVLWSRLRDRSILGVKFRRQQVLAGYILDFYCHQAKLAVELDGGQHGEPDGRSRDAHRDAVLGGLGVSVLRFWNNEVLTNISGVLEAIQQRLERRDPPSSAGAHGRSAPTSSGCSA
jgi:very-short-patch-repair endonuclease